MAIINGTAGNDTLVGTADADTIDGGAGNDTLSGLAGDDTLNGGDDFTTVTQTTDNQNNGGTGTPDGDIGVTGEYTISNPVEVDVSIDRTGGTVAILNIVANDVDQAAGGDAAERDEVYLNGVFVGLLTTTASDATGTTSFRLDPALLSASGVNRVQIRNANPASDGGYAFRIDSVAVTVERANDDTLDGGEGSDALNGGLGNDTLIVAAGPDAVEGGTGFDTLVVQYGSDTGGVSNGGFAGYEG
ncbi:MAG TPA: hypothetical protein VGB65_06575, partial [Allosphingosinicella sp.]